MAKTTRITDFRRARSDDQKARRREAILSAARQHFAEVGFEQFAMGPLAEAVGIARGTLYLYFETREEVLLALYVEEIERLVDAIIDGTPPGIDAPAFVRAYYQIATASPLYLELAARSNNSIEQNCSVDRLVELKTATRDLAFRVGDHVAQLFGMTPEKAIRFVTSLFGLLVGVAQLTQSPAVEIDLLPPEIHKLDQMMDTERLFLDAGVWMLNGVCG